MKMQLRYNPATGVWMPGEPLRPKERFAVTPPNQIRNARVVADRIPPMPALPLRPHFRMAAPKPVITGPEFDSIPIRPVLKQPNLPAMPGWVNQQAKWGKVAVVDTLNAPETFPKPNLPNFKKFDMASIKAEQARINQKIRVRGGGLPSDSRYLMQNGTNAKIFSSGDINRKLGLGKISGMNSKFRRFGNNSGYTLEQAFGA